MKVSYELLKRTDLNLTQKMIYAFLADHGGVVDNITINDIANTLAINRRTVFLNMPGLEDKGLIRIENPNSDGWKLTNTYYIL